MIVWRIRGKIIELFSSVLHTTIVCSYEHTHMSSSYRCTTACWFRFILGYFMCLFARFSYLSSVCLFCSFFVFLCIFSFVSSSVVSSSASDFLERLVSKMTYYSLTLHTSLCYILFLFNHPVSQVLLQVSPDPPEMDF